MPKVKPFHKWDHPDSHGSSEYRAIYTLMEEIHDSNPLASSSELSDYMTASLVELRDTAEGLLGGA